MDEVGTPSPLNRGNSPSHRWLLVGTVLVAVVSLLCLLVLIPTGVRALPGRYAARLPGFLQDIRQRPHPDLLPTPAIAVTPFVTSTPTQTLQRLSGVTYATTTPLSEREIVEQATKGSPRQTPVRSTRTPILPVTASATPTLAVTPTTAATSTASATPSSTPPPPTATSAQIPLAASLPPVTHTYQTWNNCGPATLSMALYYFGQSGTQADAAAFLKPDPEDKNVSVNEMAAYARSLGLMATVRVGGDLNRLKQLIAAGFPVIVETWFIPDPGDQMGHYRVLVGYDDETRQFTAQDSYNGPNVRLSYDVFDEFWRVFNRVHLVIYESSQANDLASILGEDVDDQTMYTRALETAQREALDPSTECVAYERCADGTAFAWFNVGSSLTSLGRHEEAAAAYDQARLLGLPWRMLWYQFGPYESYYAVGRYDDVITLATATLRTTNNLEESYFWRGLAYLAQGDVDRARSELQTALKYNPNFGAAKEVLESTE